MFNQNVPRCLAELTRDSLRLAGADGSAHGLVCLGVGLSRSTLEHVHRVHEFRLDETRKPERLDVLSFQESAADSGGPEIDARPRRIR